MLDFKRKPIIAMLHMKGSTDAEVLECMIEEAHIYYENGVDAVLVENYFGTSEDCERGLEWLRNHMPDMMYGVNILGDYRTAFSLAAKYSADFIQIDSVCGHLEPEKDSLYAADLMRRMQNRQFQVLGGLRFKYQPVRSGRSLEKDAELAKMRCDAVVTTGAGTGMDSPTEKLIEFRNVLRGFPLITGAGVTAENVAEKLMYTDGVIVGSWLKEFHCDHGAVSPEYVREFMERVREYRRTAE